MKKNQPKKMTEMTSEELLETFFEYNGIITKKEFKLPEPMSFDTVICLSTIKLLNSSENGTNLMLEMLKKFLKKEIDQFGKPI